MRRYWEEKTAMCINCKHNARFLGARTPFIVQCSYAPAGINTSLASHPQLRCPGKFPVLPHGSVL